MLAQYCKTKAQNAWNKESVLFKKSAHQVSLCKNELENKRLIVITAGNEDDHDVPKHVPKDWQKIWMTLQKDLASKSKKSEHWIAEKSGHMIPLQQPEIIVDAVKKMVNDLRK